jgi:hypothetical protein
MRNGESDERHLYAFRGSMVSSTAAKRFICILLVFPKSTEPINAAMHQVKLRSECALRLLQGLAAALFVVLELRS